MLICLINNNRYCAYEPEDYEVILNNKYNLVCPRCKEKILYVDATLIRKHFRHQVESNCNPEPESQNHIKIKQEVINKLNLNVDNLEIDLGFAIPDIYIPERKIAIEIQCSAISLEDFLFRTARYTENGIYVIWIFEKSLLFKFSKVANTYSFVSGGSIKKAHELYYGRVYFYSLEEDNKYYYHGINAVHFLPKERYVEEWEGHGGYTTIYKNLKDHFVVYISKEQLIFKLSHNTWKQNNYLLANFSEGLFWK